MHIEPRIRQAISRSPQLHALGGRFAIGSSIIPYFTAHMTLSEVSSCLKTPSELPGWSDENVEIEALFQRQLDYRRVNNKILPYLREPSGVRPRFFNSLTVALVPYRNARFVPFEGEFEAPDLEGTNTHHHYDAGPIKIGLYRELDANNPDTYTVAELCWNLDQVASVAIDGQHRLHAMKRLYQTAPEAALGTKVSVILILPTQLLGYSLPRDAGDLLPVLRSIFIDLNKHSVPVKRSRLILLDDVDPHSLIVRRLVGSRLEHVDDASESEHRLPLGLVDWHSDDAKFDSGPYITTVLMLDRITEHVLGVGSVKDWTAKGPVYRQFEAFKKFGFNASTDLQTRMTAFQDADETLYRSFSYTESELEKIQNTVGSTVAQLVYKVILGINAYREVVDIRRSQRMLSPDFVSWYAAFEKKALAAEYNTDFMRISERISSKQDPPNISDWQDCLKTDLERHKAQNLLFKVVFQDALFLALDNLRRKELLVIREREIPEGGGVANLIMWADYIVDFVNTLYASDRHVYSTEYAIGSDDGTEDAIWLWLGYVVDPSSMNIDYTKSASKRTSQLIEFCAMIYAAMAEVSVEAEGQEQFGDYDGFVSYLQDRDEDFANDLERLRSINVTGVRGNRGAQMRVMKVAASDIEEEDEQISAAFERFDRIADFIIRSLQVD